MEQFYIQGKPSLYFVETGQKVENGSCHCKILDVDTALPSMQCFWELDDYYIYLSFATSTFSVINAVTNRGLVESTETMAQKCLPPLKKALFISLGILSGCYGLTVGMYLIYIKSLTLSPFLLFIIPLLFVRICPMKVATYLSFKLFPQNSVLALNTKHSSNAREFFSLISPFWFCNLLRGAEFLLTSVMDANYRAMLRNSFPMKNAHPSLMLTVPCRYGKTPSATNCIKIHSMLDGQKWHLILDKLYHHFYKLSPIVFKDDGYFIEFAYELRKDLKGIRLMTGNFSFLQPYATHENSLLVVDSVLLGTLSLLSVWFSSPRTRKRWRSIGVISLEVGLRIVCISLDMTAVTTNAFSLLGIWSVLEIFSCVILLVLRIAERLKESRLVRRVLWLSHSVAILTLPVLPFSASTYLKKDAMYIWQKMNDFCATPKIATLSYIDGRNVVEEIATLKDGNYSLFLTHYTRDQLQNLVVKNDLELVYLKRLSQIIYFQTWQPVILATSLVPILASALFLIHKKRGKGWWSLKVHMALKKVVIALSMCIIPVALWAQLRPGKLYEIQLIHDDGEWVKTISTTPLNYSASVLDTEYLRDLLNTTEVYFDILMEESRGFGKCYRPEKYQFPFEILAELGTNISNLKNLLMYHKYFIFCLAPVLLLYHIYYCCY